MVARRPFRLTPAQVDEVWSRRQAGQAVKVLSREMRVGAMTVYDLLRRTVGCVRCLGGAGSCG